jgi:lysophospholipase I
MAHGTADPLLRFQLGKQSSEMLIDEFGWKKEDFSVDKPAGLIFKSYSGMQHSACPEEISDLKEWLRKVIPNEQN